VYKNTDGSCSYLDLVKSLEQIVFKRCEEKYYDEYRSYKHHENETELRAKIKSSTVRYGEFVEFIKNVVLPAAGQQVGAPKQGHFLYYGNVGLS
jgi:hypothetical protein